MKAPIVLFVGGCAWLCLAAIGHCFAHWVFYVDTDGFTGERRAVVDAMQHYAIDSPIPGSLWTMLQMFSLEFALLLGFAGLINLIVLRADRQRALLTTVATFNAWFWLLATATIAVTHPVIQSLVIGGGAGVLFAVSAALLRRRRI